MGKERHVNTHFYDKYSLEDQVDSIRYSNDARMEIKDVLNRGKVPILEGGSMFFHKQIFKGNSMSETAEETDLFQNSRL